MIVARRAGNVTQLHRVAAPGSEPEQLTAFSEPVRFGAYLAKKPGVLVFARDTGGNEQRQLYRLDAATATPELLTDPRRKHDAASFTHARDYLLVASTDVDATGKRDSLTTDLMLLDPLEPTKSRELARLPGTGWFDFSFSFDDKRMALVEFKSVNETHVWLMDLATGARRRVLPAEGERPTQPIASVAINFARDGKGLFLATDRDGEFRKLAYLDLGTGKLEYFGEGGDWDVEDIALSPDGHTLAVITNEAGVGVLRLYDADTRRALPRPQLPVGTVGRPTWHQNSRDLAVTVASAQSPSDAYTVDVRNNRVERWTEDKVAGLDASSFRSMEPIAWKSFDARVINGFLARPPARFTGKRPVIVMIHGGPEGQARPGFLGRWNYFIDELGIALIEPNVRGSTGYAFPSASPEPSRSSASRTSFRSSRTPRVIDAISAASNTATSATRQCVNSSPGYRRSTMRRRSRRRCLSSRAETTLASAIPRPSRSSPPRARTACRSGICSPKTKDTASHAR